MTTKTEHRDSHEYVICPHCGATYGDCWEWAADTYPTDKVCDDCGKTFKYWADYLVTYYTEAEVEQIVSDGEESIKWNGY